MTWRALTGVTANSVDAVSSKTKHGIYRAFINVHAHHHHHCTLKAFVTDALKSTRKVSTRSIAAGSRKYVTFINICTVVSVVREVVTWFTDADEAADRVTTATVCTEIWEHSAFIDINKWSLCSIGSCWPGTETCSLLTKQFFVFI